MGAPVGSDPNNPQTSEAVALADRRLAFQTAKNKEAADQAARLKSQGLNADGSPIRPEFESLLNEDGSIQDAFKLGGFEDVSVNDQGLDKFRSEALRDGPSQFANLQQQQLGVQQGQRRDDAAAQAAQGRAQAFSQLAQSGGLSGAARERIGQSGARNLLQSRQNIARQGQQSGLDISAQDEQRRIGQLQQLPGMEMQRAGLDERNRAFNADIQSRNVGAGLAEKNLQRTQDLDAWRERMQSFSTGKQADAQAAAGSGGKK